MKFFRSIVLSGIWLVICQAPAALVTVTPVAPFSPAGGPDIFILDTNLADYPSRTIPRFSKFEITFSLNKFYTNPFNPNEIQVDGYFTSPDHATVVQPAFYYQDFEMTRLDDHENYTASGNAVWKVRFTPRQVGAYQYLLKARDQNGASSTTTFSFQVVPSNGAGFIRVSKINPRYFEFERGDPFLGLGLNVAWWQDERRRLSTFEYFLGRMSAFKANLARVWMTNSGRNQNWILSIQDDQLGSNYNLEEAWAFDKILDLAMEKQVYFLLTLDDVNQYTYNWTENLYNSDLGGPCSNRSEIFTNPFARSYQQRIFRYILARWGYSPNILSWELFNEVDELQWSDPAHWDPQAMRDWHSQMGEYIATIDAHHHLVNTSTGSFKTHPDLFGLSTVDLAEMHFFFVPDCCHDRISDPAGRDMADLMRYYAYRIYHSVTGKPSLIGEWGLLNENWTDSPYLDLDDQGIHLHNGLWSSVMSGMATAGLNWHWKSHQTHDPVWWKHYYALANYLSNLSLVDLTVMKPIHVDFSLPGASDNQPDAFAASNPQIRVMGLDSREGMYIWAQNKNHTWWNYVHAVATPPQSGTLTILNLTPGQSYLVETWDTYRNFEQVVNQEVLRVPASRSLTLSINKLQTDLAFKLRPISNSSSTTLMQGNRGTLRFPSNLFYLFNSNERVQDAGR